MRFGKYTLLEKIGAGGMAEIWRASLSGVDGFEKILVVKKILPKFARNRQFITMFVQEAKVTSILHHANIVQLYELGEHEGDYYIAMEYVAGPDLLRILTTAAKKKHPIPPEICLYIMIEVCKGLGYAHAATDIYGNPLNMVHLDVSPSNILVSWDGEVKLTDFGVAKASNSDGPSAADDRLKGKLGYMSPEQVTAKRIDHRSDLFSIGIILYEIFTLKRLFLGRTEIETLTNVRDADIDARLARHTLIPPAVQEIIRHSLLRNVETRYQSAYEIEEAVSQYLFEQRLRVTPHALSRFLSELFERERRMNTDPPISGEASEVLRLPQVPLSQHTTRVSERARSRRGDDAPDPLKAMPPARPANLETGRFSFKTGRGGLFGPIDAATLRRLANAKAVSPDELVSVDGDPWRPLREVTGIGGIVGDTLNAEKVTPTDAGDFGPKTSFRLISEFVTRGRTARLRVTTHASTKEIWFRKGRPIQALSTQKDELLGSVLVRTKLITPEQLDAGLTRSLLASEPLGVALVAIKALDPLRLAQGLEQQLSDRFVTLFAVVDGRYEVLPMPEAAPDALPIPFDPYPALADGGRRYLTSAFLDRYAAESDGRAIRLAADLPYDAARLKLAPREHRVYTAITGRPTTVQALLAAHGKTPETREVVLLVLFLLHQTGLVRLA